MGRKSTPTSLKVLRGNPGKRPINTDEPQPDLLCSVPEPPENLGEIARQEWGRLAGELISLKLLTALDTTMLEVYCESYEQYRQAEAEIKTHFKKFKKYTVTYTNKANNENEVPHPALRIKREALDIMRSVGSEFGFTPASRTKLKVPPQTQAGSKLLTIIKNRGNRSG